jgi:DNA-directed RNA polymerase subunit H (RpoH/RPB5)
MAKQGYQINDHEGFSVNEINTMKTNSQLDIILTNINKTSETETKTKIYEEGVGVEEYKEGFNDKDKSNKEEKKIYIKYYIAKALRPNNLQEMIDDLFVIEEILTKKDTLLVVVKDDLNETLINTVKHIWESEGIFIILIPLKRLQFNILEHSLVPQHRILSEDEKNAVKKKYNIEDNQFPELIRFDPVAQAIGIRPGQVCEIIRPSKTAITALYYRICI